MKKPQYRYEIKRENGVLPYPQGSASFPEFKDTVDKYLDFLGDDECGEDFIVIRKIKNE